MYITTFYSFKGGVGRTMALVNAAVDLVQRGKRVLMVDFDLEAPGLDTFDLPRGDGPKFGMVDFVHHYLRSSQAPEVAAYLYESPGIGREGGKLWIMPSGSPEESYAQRLSEIEWKDLYERRNGYLLFEDLKLQWDDSIKPDYVFIDSRTGHTDVGGICTRQLPDAVVILAFPNEQNLRGLTKVVRDIRAEGAGPRQKDIKLHLVLSNVPDIDDEDLILEGIIESFQERLGFKEDMLVIHRYQSLSLLSQSIFARDRPKSRLAMEYRRLVEKIRLNNLGDRDCAIRRLRSMYNESDPMHDDQIDDDTSDLLSKISTDHNDDGEVQFEIGQVFSTYGLIFEAKDTFDRAIELGVSGPEIYLARMGLWNSDLDNPDLAAQDALKVLDFSGLTADQFDDSVATLKSSPVYLERILDSPSVKSLPIGRKIKLAKEFNTSAIEANISRQLLLSIPSVEAVDWKAQMQQIEAQGALISAYLAVGEYSEIVVLLSTPESEVGGMSIENAFSLGMATWGMTGAIEPVFFEQVVGSEDSLQVDYSTLSSSQRRAISLWAVGQTDEAREIANAILKVWRETSSFQFSFWRFLLVPARLFRQDIEELIKLIDGDAGVIPQFMVANENS